MQFPAKPLANQPCVMSLPWPSGPVVQPYPEPRFWAYTYYGTFLKIHAIWNSKPINKSRNELILNFFSSKHFMCGVRLLSLHHPMKLSKASSKRLWIDLPGNRFIRAIATKPPAARSAPAPRLKQCNISGRAMVGDCAPGINRRGEIALPRLNGSGGSSDHERSWQWAGLMSHHSWASVWAGKGSQIEDNPGRWIKLRDLGRNKNYLSKKSRHMWGT